MQIVNAKPLCYLNDGRVVFYKNGSLLFYAVSPFQYLSSFKLKLGLKEMYFARIKFLYRLLRLGPKIGIQIHGDILLFFIGGCFYEYNLFSRVLIKGWTPNKNTRPMKITDICNVDGFEDMVVFGEYISCNSNKCPISIYKRIDANNWKPIFSFDKGVVNHIHNIVPDRNNRCVWILTGDFDSAANIWCATNNFKRVNPISDIGGQIFRGCVAFPYDGGLLYATDSPYEQNSIRLLQRIGSRWESKFLSEINGSCIYGTKISDNIIISTAVEPDPRNKSLFSMLLSRKRGPGIKDKYIYIYMVNSYGCKSFFRVKKDILPALFQYGVIMFPEGDTHTSKLLSYCIATEKYDCKTLVIDIPN